MEKLHEKYFVAAAVFFMVVSFTSSAADLGQACNGTGAGNCTAPNAVCESTCVCKGSYKANADNSACIKRGLNDTCTNDPDCDGVTNAECVGTSNKVCTCKADAKAENGLCNAAYGLQTLLSASVAVLLSFLMIVVTRLH